MERHYVVYMLGTPTCTLYTTKALTEECCLTVLVYTLSVGTLSCWLPCCAHFCWFRVLNPGMLQFHSRLLLWVSVSPIVGNRGRITYMHCAAHVCLYVGAHAWNNFLHPGKSGDLSNPLYTAITETPLNNKNRSGTGGFWKLDL